MHKVFSLNIPIEYKYLRCITPSHYLTIQNRCVHIFHCSRWWMHKPHCWSLCLPSSHNFFYCRLGCKFQWWHTFPASLVFIWVHDIGGIKDLIYSLGEDVVNLIPTVGVFTSVFVVWLSWGILYIVINIILLQPISMVQQDASLQHIMVIPFYG